MRNPYRAFRRLERLIFRGVPEHPEPLWFRNDNAHVPERLTGRSQLSAGLPDDALNRATLIATIVYCPATEEVEYIRQPLVDTAATFTNIALAELSGRPQTSKEQL